MAVVDASVALASAHAAGLAHAHAYDTQVSRARSHIAVLRTQREECAHNIVRFAANVLSMASAVLHADDQTVRSPEDIIQFVSARDPGVPRPVSSFMDDGDEDEGGAKTPSAAKTNPPPVVAMARKSFYELLYAGNGDIFTATVCDALSRSLVDATTRESPTVRAFDTWIARNLDAPGWVKLRAGATVSHMSGVRQYGILRETNSHIKSHKTSKPWIWLCVQSVLAGVIEWVHAGKQSPTTAFRSDVVRRIEARAAPVGDCTKEDARALSKVAHGNWLSDMALANMNLTAPWKGGTLQQETMYAAVGTLLDSVAAMGDRMPVFEAPTVADGETFTTCAQQIFDACFRAYIVSISKPPATIAAAKSLSMYITAAAYTCLSTGTFTHTHAVMLDTTPFITPPSLPSSPPTEDYITTHTSDEEGGKK
jgi:hypothetical protein